MTKKDAIDNLLKLADACNFEPKRKSELAELIDKIPDELFVDFLVVMQDLLFEYSDYKIKAHGFDSILESQEKTKHKLDGIAGLYKYATENGIMSLPAVLKDQ